MDAIKSSLILKVGNVYQDDIGHLISIVSQNGTTFRDQNHNDYEMDGKSITFCDDASHDLVRTVIHNGKMANQYSYYNQDDADYYKKVELKVTVLVKNNDDHSVLGGKRSGRHDATYLPEPIRCRRGNHVVILIEMGINPHLYHPFYFFFRQRSTSQG